MDISTLRYIEVCCVCAHTPSMHQPVTVPSKRKSTNHNCWPWLKSASLDASTCPIKSANKSLGPLFYRFRSMNSVQTCELSVAPRETFWGSMGTWVKFPPKKTLMTHCFKIPAMSTWWHWDIVCVSLRADAALERDETGQGFLRPPEHHFFEESKLTISKRQRRLFKWIEDSCAGCARKVWNLSWQEHQTIYADMNSSVFIDGDIYSLRGVVCASQTMVPIQMGIILPQDSFGYRNWA